MIWIHFYAVTDTFWNKTDREKLSYYFDEVQMFPQARAAIKYLVADAQKAIKAKNDGKTEGRTK